MYVHLECQRRMLDASLQMRGPHNSSLRCGACHGKFSNAEAVPVWRLSMLGALSRFSRRFTMGGT